MIWQPTPKQENPKKTAHVLVNVIKAHILKNECLFISAYTW